jgi:signal transduction histidine kinase/ActR/RegA family two-component response regulator
MARLRTLRHFIVIRPALWTLLGLLTMIAFTSLTDYQAFKHETITDSERFEEYVLNVLQITGGGREFERSANVIRGSRNIKLLLVSDQSHKLLASSAVDFRGQILDDALMSDIAKKYNIPRESLNPGSQHWAIGIFSARTDFKMFNLGDITGGEILVIWDTEQQWLEWISSTLKGAAGILLIGLLVYWSLFRGIKKFVQIPLRALQDNMAQFDSSSGISKPDLPAMEWETMFATFRQMAENINQKHAELTKAQKIAEGAAEARKAFLSNMTHEMRTPLNGVIGMVEDLSSSPLTKDQVEKVALMRDSGMILLSLINDILDFSKIDAGKIEIERTDFQLHNTLEAIIRVTGDSARRKGLEMTLEIAPDCPKFVSGDVGRLRQILLNLTGNAIKFTNSGKISVSVTHRDGIFSIVVSDSGVGMTNAQLERLFKPFSQVDQSVTRKFGGTGLGLAISRDLAVLMGGDITVTSSPGKGSTFTLTLPFNPADAVTETPANAVFQPQDYSRLRVLVVEDNLVNQTVMKSFLKKFSIVPVFADDGGAGYDVASANPFDVIFMDLQMPVMGGIEVTEKLRKNPGPNQSTRVIALTANASNEDVDACYAAGMNGFLSKPLTLSELTKALASITPPKAS